MLINNDAGQPDLDNFTLSAKSRGLFHGATWVWQQTGQFANVTFASKVEQPSGNEKVKMQGNKKGMRSMYLASRWVLQKWPATTTPSVHFFTDVSSEEVAKLRGKEDSIKRALDGNNARFSIPQEGEPGSFKVRGTGAIEQTASRMLKDHGVRLSGTRWCVRSLDNCQFADKLEAESGAIRAKYPKVRVFFSDRQAAAPVTISGPSVAVEKLIAEYNVQREAIQIKSKPAPAAALAQADLHAWERRLVAWEERLKKQEAVAGEVSLLGSLRIGVQTAEVGTMTEIEEAAPKCDWTEHSDKTTKKTFFYNNITKKSQWHKPDELLALENWKKAQKEKKEAEEEEKKKEQERQRENAEREKVAAEKRAAEERLAKEAAERRAAEEAVQFVQPAQNVPVHNVPQLPLVQPGPPTAVPSSDQLEGSLFNTVQPFADNTDSVNALLKSMVQVQEDDKKNEVNVMDLLGMSGANTAPPTATAAAPAVVMPAGGGAASRVPPTAKTCFPEIKQFLETTKLSHLQHLFTYAKKLRVFRRCSAIM